MGIKCRVIPTSCQDKVLICMGYKVRYIRFLKYLKFFFFVKMFNFANFDILLVLSQDNGMLNPCLLLSTS